MSVSPAKENILKKIRQALSHPVPVPFPNSEGNNSVFQPPVDDMAVQFAQQFTSLQGKFVFCADEQDMAAKPEPAADGQPRHRRVRTRAGATCAHALSFGRTSHHDDFKPSQHHNPRHGLGVDLDAAI